MLELGRATLNPKTLTPAQGRIGIRSKSLGFMVCCGSLQAQAYGFGISRWGNPGLDTTAP